MPHNRPVKLGDDLVQGIQAQLQSIDVMIDSVLEGRSHSIKLDG